MDANYPNRQCCFNRPRGVKGHLGKNSGQQGRVQAKKAKFEPPRHKFRPKQAEFELPGPARPSLTAMSNNYALILKIC